MILLLFDTSHSHVLTPAAAGLSQQTAAFHSTRKPRQISFSSLAEHMAL